MEAQRRTARAGFQLLAGGALIATLVMTPATAAARTPDPTDHTTATRVATVQPDLIGVPRSTDGGSALGVPAAAGGGAGALRALRQPGATVPQRQNLPRWLPQRRHVAAAAATPNASRAAATATASIAASAANGIAPKPAAAATPTGDGLRSELGTFGLSDSDDSLLYPDCSVFELCEEPPDPGVAVSSTSVVQSVNELILILDRATNGSRVIPNFDFFALDNNQVAQSDPRVLYDNNRHRWIATEISSDCSHGYLHMAVSSSDDPFGAWTVYRIVFPNLIVDFPGVGTSSDTVVVSLNAFAADPKSADCLSAGDFEGGMLAVFDWSDLLGTVPTLPVTTTAPDAGLFTWRPATTTGDNSLARMVVAIDNGTDTTSDVGYATVSGTNAAHNVTVSPVVNLTKTAGLAPFATPPAPRQPSDPKTIVSAVDGQPTDAIAAGGHLWFIATAPCTPAADTTVRDCVRLTDLVTGAGPSDVAVQSDTRFGESGMDLFMGGVGRSFDGTVFVVYSRSSTEDPIAGWATWRRPTDTAFHAPSLIIPGTGTYDGSRWGDYVILAPDPSATDSVWQGNQVPSVDGSWFTWLSRIRPAPNGPLDGSVRINGGDKFAAESFVDLELTNPAHVAATVVRVANGPAMKDGLLVGGQTMPIAADLPWSLDVDQPGDIAPDGTRTVYVQWGDGQGHWSDVASDEIILDTTPPTIGAFLAPQIATSTLGASGTVPVELRWGGGRDALSGLEGYDVEVSEDDGEWEDFASTGSTHATGRVAAGHVYVWRVRSFDRLGNASDFIESGPVHVTVIDDASTSVKYGTGWRVAKATAAYKSTSHVATRNGATATITFTGRNVAIVGSVGRGSLANGGLTAFVDGKRVGLFVQSGATSSRVEVIGLRATLKPGRHVLRLVATAAASQPANLDAVIVLR